MAAGYGNERWADARGGVAQGLGNAIGAFSQRNVATVPDVEALERRVVELEARLRTP